MEFLFQRWSRNSFFYFYCVILKSWSQKYCVWENNTVQIFKDRTQAVFAEMPLFCFPETMDQKIPYDDYQLPVVFLPSYENPPAWIPPHEVCYPLIHEPSKKIMRALFSPIKKMPLSLSSGTGFVRHAQHCQITSQFHKELHNVYFLKNPFMVH